MMQSDDDDLSRPIQPVDSSLDVKIERPSRETWVAAADVLCGRGKTSFNHAGNKRFRDAVSSALNEYMEAHSRFEKAKIIHAIVDIIRVAGGRFMKRDFHLGKWYELTDQQAKEKVGHAIRDAVNSYESKAKKARKNKNAEQKAVRKGWPRSERKDSGDSSGSGGTASRAAHKSLAIVSGRLVPSGVSASSPLASSHTIADAVVSTLSINDDGHDPQDQQFLAQIDAVLGPLPPDAKDPMEPYLKQSE